MSRLTPFLFPGFQPMDKEQAINRICELVLRDRIRLKKGELAQAYIDLADALHSLTRAATKQAEAACKNCASYRNRMRMLELRLRLVHRAHYDLQCKPDYGPQHFAEAIHDLIAPMWLDDPDGPTRYNDPDDPDFHFAFDQQT